MKNPIFLLIGLMSLSLITTAQQHPAVTRTLLGSGNPIGAQGWTLSMYQVVFAPGAKIPAEIHTGMQVVYIVSGQLAVKILGGEAQIRRAMPDGSQGPVETVQAGPNEVIINAGDTFVEPETLVLAPRNPGKVPLVILTSSLLPNGKGQSIPITQPIDLK